MVHMAGHFLPDSQANEVESLLKWTHNRRRRVGNTTIVVEVKKDGYVVTKWSIKKIHGTLKNYYFIFT